LERREGAYRDQLPRPEVRGKVVILVDDGLATGSSMRAAVAAIRQQEPARVVVAVPVGNESACQELERDADQVICASTEPLVAVGQAYRNFEQTTDEEVRGLLHAAGAAGAARDEPPTAGPTGVGPGTGVGTAGTGTRLLPLIPATSMALSRAPPTTSQTPKRHGRARERLTAGPTVMP
jgi:Phosphoribosyl transferase domain